MAKRPSTFLLAVAAMLLADITPAAEVEEIIVTARKREESLQEVPVAIQAFQTEQIERYASTNLNLIADMANNVEFTPRSNNGGGGTFNVRGMAASASDAGIDASVAVNIDGVQTSRGYITHLGFYDMQSVEILKGPQALFYGKDSPAGVIGTHSALPTDEFEAKVMVGYETETQEKITELMVSGPLLDTLNGRAFLRYSDMGRSWIDNEGDRIPVNATNPYFIREPYDLPGAITESGKAEEVFYRITLDWQPTDNFRAILRMNRSKVDSEGFNAGEIGRCGLPDGSGPGGDQVFIQPIFGAAYGGPFLDPNADCESNWRTSYGSMAPEIGDNWSNPRANRGPTSGELWGESRVRLNSLNMNLDLEWATIESITGYVYYNVTALENFGGQSYPAMMGYNPDKHHQYSQELRLITQFDGPVNFMIGGYYDEFRRAHAASVKLGTFGPDPDTGISNDLDVRQRTEGKSRAVFGQIIWDITDQWEFTAGARYTDDEKESTQTNVYVHNVYEDLSSLLLGIPGLIPSLWREEGLPLFAEFSDDHVSPEATLTFRPTNNHTIWVAYKTGYKGGGISNPTLLNNGDEAEDVIFFPEEADGFELGTKSTFLDGRLRANLTAYIYEFKDLQVSVLDTETTIFQILNAGVAETKGVELDARFVVNEYVTLEAEVGYNIGKYKSFPNAACYTFQPLSPDECTDLDGNPLTNDRIQDLSGSDLPNAPKWSGSAGIELFFPLTDAWNLSLNVTGQFKDDVLGAADGNPLSAQDSWFKLHTRVGVSSANGKWDLHFIGRNITNKRGADVAGVRPAGITPWDSFTGGTRGRQLLFQLAYRI